MRESRGFTYVGLLLGVALAGTSLALVGQVWSTTSKRERERELLFVGSQFRYAIGLYYESSPGVKQYPRRLEDLVEDKRFPVARRYLRKIYPDPMSGKTDWGLLMQGDQILGVYSQSREQPLKVANFDLGDAMSADGTTYSDWRFVYAPAGAASAGQAAHAADAQLANAAAPNFDAPEPPAQASDASSPAEPAFDAPQEAWVCDAGRASELRDCKDASGAARQTCEQAAMQGYKACMRSAANAAQPFGSR
jgi:type II secretory pathway pseudopilin PulG